MLDQVLPLEELKAMACRAVEIATKKGADQAEAFVSMDASLSCGLEKDAIKGVGTSVSMGMGIRVIKDRRLGFSYATEESSLPETAEQAIKLARLSPPGDLEFPGDHTPPVVERIFDPQILNTTPSTLVEWVKDMLAVVKGHEELVALEGGVGCGLDRFAVATSNGMDLGAEGTDSGGGMYTMFQDLAPSTGFHFAESRMADIDLLGTAEKASKMALDSRNPSTVEPGLMPVVFMPHAFSSMMEFILAPAFYGDKVKRGESVYSGREGMEVASPELDVFDDALLPDGLNSAPIDDEGVPSKKVPIIENGIFFNPLYDRSSGLEHGAETTGNGIRCLRWSSSRSFKSPPGVKARNLVMGSGLTMPLDELLKEVKKGILVHDILGAHTANPASGDFSVNSSVVFKIERGEITGPGKQVMLSGNLPDALRELIGTGERPLNVSGGLSPVSFRLPSIALDKIVVT
ncbi:MAG: TldD/PmbA family protein [Thermoplasmata archaeon]|nr:TldD/PmbA family protein [Thermoplasmata archaeon]